jgi:hypothetical protein
MEHHGIRKLIQVQDNAKSHNSKNTQRFHAEHPRIVPFFLPSYSPQLNDEEAQNRRLKHYLCCNQSYDSVTDLEKKAHTGIYVRAVFLLIREDLAELFGRKGQIAKRWRSSQTRSITTSINPNQPKIVLSQCRKIPNWQ